MGTEGRREGVTMRLARCSFLIAAFLTLAGAAVAGPFEDAAAAYDRKDYAAALQLLRPLVDQGNGVAQFDLGFMYYNGQGVPQNYAEAASWYRKAADQGIADAQYDLGVMYAHGQGVPQDYILAHMWFNLAAAQGNQDALKFRDIIAGIMTSAQIAEAQRLARDWKPK